MAKIDTQFMTKRAGGGGVVLYFVLRWYTIIQSIQGHVAGQGMVFWPLRPDQGILGIYGMSSFSKI